MISDLSAFTPAVPDLVITAARIIDPARGLDVLADISVLGDRIGAIGRDLAVGVPRDRVIDGTGLLVVPGLIDLHTRVVPGLGDLGVDPDRAGVDQGVTTVVDAGTCGTATAGLVRAWLAAARPRTRVLAFADPATVHVATRDGTAERLGIGTDPRNLDADAVAALLESAADLVVGLSVRPDPSPVLDRVLAVAGDRPVMVPAGRGPLAPSVLAALRNGDVITHALGANGAAVLLDEATGGPTEAFVDAAARGVRHDLILSPGTGFAGARLADVRRLLDAGYLPDTVSTGLDVARAGHPAVSLTEALSTVWALGASLDEVLSMATINAARAIGRAAELGTLEAGRVADLSVLSIEEAPVTLTDGDETLPAERRLVPVGCVRAGQWVEATAVVPAVAA